MSGLESRKRGRTGNRQLAPGLANTALALIRDRSADVGLTLACEKLREVHGIVMAIETIRRLMTDTGRWIPRRQRTAKIYQPRKRRNCIKEMRLLGISTMEAANAYAPTFIDSFNNRFAKPPSNDFNANRPLREDEDIDLILTVRAPRRVTNNLTLQYDRTMYLLTDTPAARAVMGKYVELYDYPDGRIEVRAHGAALAYITYDRLSEIDQGAVVENKRSVTHCRPPRSCKNSGITGVVDHPEPVRPAKSFRRK